MQGLFKYLKGHELLLLNYRIFSISQAYKEPCDYSARQHLNLGKIDQQKVYKHVAQRCEQNKNTEATNQIFFDKHQHIK